MVYAAKLLPLWLMIGLAAAAATAADAGVRLASGGKTDYVIIQGTNATPAEQFAARELSAFLGKATGAAFAILTPTNRPVPARAIHVGWTGLAGQSLDLAALGQEEWVIRTQDGNLLLAGGRPRGTLYAVYEFLEREVGIRWLDELTEVVPPRRNLHLGALDRRDQPAFWDRKIYTSTEGPLTDLFNVRNKDTRVTSAEYGYGVPYGAPSETHTLHYYAKAWPTNHPAEYLAMNAHGERPRAVNSSGPGQVCMTHPDVRRLMLESLRGYIEADRKKAALTGAPPPRIYAIESNDNPLSCQCPECRAFAGREQSASGPFLDLVNELADGVKDDYPDVLVDTFAYLQTLVFPKTIRPRDNVLIRIAQLNAFGEMNTNAVGYKLPERPDYFRPMTHPVNRSCLDRFMDWARHARHMTYWDYWVIYTDPFMTPYVNLSCIKPDLLLFRENHVETMFVENEHADSSSFYALKRWVGLKLMQDPRQDDQALIADFMSGYYGPAAPAMTGFLRNLERRIGAFTDQEKLSFRKALERPYLDLDFFETSLRMLDEAERLCGTNEAVRFRVQRERSPVDSGLLGCWGVLQAKLPPGKTMPFDRDAVIRRYVATRRAQIEAMPSWPYKGKEKALNTLKRERVALEEAPLIEAWKKEPPPVLRIPRLPAGEASGNPADVDWSRAAGVAAWRTLGGGTMPERRVRGALAHDGTCLYVLMEEPLQTARLDAKEYGDTWQLFFAGKRGRAPYSHLSVNPRGEHEAHLYGATPAVQWQSPWNNRATVTSSRTDGRWRVQVAIPLAEIIPGGVAPGRPFYANIVRGTSIEGEYHGVSLAWSSPFRDQFSRSGGMHDISRLAEVTLE